MEETVQETSYVRIEKQTEEWKEGSTGIGSRLVLWLIGAISTVVLLFFLGNVFSGATITITPKSQNVKVDLNLIAKPNAATGELAYTLFTTSRDKDGTLQTDGEKPVESRASGRIIIYNNYSTSAQRLVKNTRFETPDGLIYRLADSVTVPGRHSVGGKIVPGSIEVSVYAETAGDEYNIGLTDFTVPGFKSNTERFNNFYGRSKTPMTGGKIGMQKVVSDEKMNQTRTLFEQSLIQDLLVEAKKQAPKDSVFYDGAYSVEFESIPSGTIAAGNNVTIRERAHFTAFFFKQADLARAIALNSLENFDGAPIDVPNINNLKFQINDSVKFRAGVVGPISFKLSGDASVIWRFDEDKLKSDIVGKNKSELLGVVSKYPAIALANVTIRPFWKTAFPSSPSKIKIETAPNEN